MDGLTDRVILIYPSTLHMDRLTDRGILIYPSTRPMDGKGDAYIPLNKTYRQTDGQGDSYIPTKNIVNIPAFCETDSVLHKTLITQTMIVGTALFCCTRF